MISFIRSHFYTRLDCGWLLYKIEFSKWLLYQPRRLKHFVTAIGFLYFHHTRPQSTQKRNITSSTQLDTSRFIYQDTIMQLSYRKNNTRTIWRTTIFTKLEFATLLPDPLHCCYFAGEKRAANSNCCRNRGPPSLSYIISPQEKRFIGYPLCSIKGAKTSKSRRLLFSVIRSPLIMSQASAVSACHFSRTIVCQGEQQQRYLSVWSTTKKKRFLEKVISPDGQYLMHMPVQSWLLLGGATKLNITQKKFLLQVRHWDTDKTNSMNTYRLQSIY